MGSAAVGETTLGGGVGITLVGAADGLVRERVRCAIGSSGARGMRLLDTLGDDTTSLVAGTRTLGGLVVLTLGWVRAGFGQRGNGRDSFRGGAASF